MTLTTTIRHHAGLVDRMAQTLGLDLEEEVMRGRIGPDMLPDMVLRCTGCAHPDRCETWLQQNAPQVAEAQPDTTPYYCRNAEVFDDLRRP